MKQSKLVELITTVVSKMSGDDITDESIDQYINDNKNQSSEPDNNKLINVVKQFEEEDMIAIEPLYINTGDVDAHGEGVTEKSLDNLVDSFNENIENIQGNIHHEFMTKGFKPLKAYRMQMDVHVGDVNKPSEMIKIDKGQPIVEVQYFDKDLWEMRKSGVLGAPSVGCKASRTPNPNYIKES